MKNLKLISLILFITLTALNCEKDDGPPVYPTDPGPDLSNQNLTRVIVGKENSLVVLFDARYDGYDYSTPKEITLEHEIVTEGPITGPITEENDKFYFTNSTNQLYRTDEELSLVSTAINLYGPATSSVLLRSIDRFMCDELGNCYNIGGELAIMDTVNVTNGVPLHGSPAYLSDNLDSFASNYFVGGDDGKIRRITKFFGEDFGVGWEFETDGPIRTNPLVVSREDSEDYQVIVGSEDGVLYALSATSGELFWQFNVGSPIKSSPEINLMVDETIGHAWADRLVFIGADNGKIYAIDGDNGDLRWDYQTGGAVSSPQFWPEGPYSQTEEGYVYACSEDGSVYGFSSDSGELLWSTPLNDGPILSSPVCINFLGEINEIAPFTVYVTTGSGVYGLDGYTGEIRSQIQLGGAAIASPVVSNYYYSANVWTGTSYPSDVSAGF